MANEGDEHVEVSDHDDELEKERGDQGTKAVPKDTNSANPSSKDPPQDTPATKQSDSNADNLLNAPLKQPKNPNPGSHGVHIITPRKLNFGSTPISSGPSGSDNTGGFSYDDLQKMIDEGVGRQIRERERNNSVCSFLDADKGPLAPEIYLAPDSDIRIPQLDNFKGASDNRDPESFIYGFRERMRLVRASDEVMCRTFCTCLTSEAWEWYVRLPQGSIKSFSDFANAFLKRYAGIKGPRVSCESLLSIKQGDRETLKDFVKRFTDMAKKVDPSTMR